MSAKYPRTLHLPWSPGGTSDDKRIDDVEHLLGRSLVMTEKLDGSNVCLTSESVFARSHSGPPKHPSFSPLKALHAQVQSLIPPHLSIFGEWCYAVHSIQYDRLHHYLNLFGVRDDATKVWLPWVEVKDWSQTLGVRTVPRVHLFSPESKKELRDLTTTYGLSESRYGDIREGIVIRPWECFADEVFNRFVLKWVRKDHVQTDKHWSKGPFDVQPLWRRE